MTQHNGSEIEPKKVPLKLVMDPRHVQDMNTMRSQFGYEPSPMSPEFGYELVNALNAPSGKGLTQRAIFYEDFYQLTF